MMTAWHLQSHDCGGPWLVHGPAVILPAVVMDLQDSGKVVQSAFPDGHV